MNLSLVRDVPVILYDVECDENGEPIAHTETPATLQLDTQPDDTLGISVGEGHPLIILKPEELRTLAHSMLSWLDG